MTQKTPLFSRSFRLSELASLAGRPIQTEATAEERAAIAAAFDLAELSTLRFEGEIGAADDGIWRLKGAVTAEAVQTCVVTLAPLKTRIEERIGRLYSELPLTEEEEVEIDPEGDDPPDPLGEALDYGEAALEAFSLALDPYPRAPGAEFGALSAAPPGKDPIDEAETRPFAGLAALKQAMERGD